MEPIQLAAVLAAVVLVASMISVELGLSVALIELGLGVVIGNVSVSIPTRTGLCSSRASPRSS